MALLTHVYIGIHKERRIRSLWKTPRLGEQNPLLRHQVHALLEVSVAPPLSPPLDPTKLDENAPLPKAFQAAEEWPDHIQRVSAAFFQPGAHLAVDECMVRYTGRSTATTVVRGKPTPLGFKIWVIAQASFFIRWLWHFKGSNYNALGRGAKVKEREAASKEAAPLIQLGNMQGVVVSLCDSLPKQTYHLFEDNFFSTPPLFRKLRDHGYGATATARPNCAVRPTTKLLDTVGTNE
ncbi:hypothetical protein FOXYSP1_18994 [Fusarium oxysporum f. sp. phaseoli]